MDLSTLQLVLETAPGRLKTLEEEIAERTDEKCSLAFFLEAVRRLRTSWQDPDPGKYYAHWHGFKDGKKAWPRELVDAKSAAKYFKERGELKPPFALLADLDIIPCPACRTPALSVCEYRQSEDGPFGDMWIKSHYALCIHCACLHQASPTQHSTRRF